MDNLVLDIINDLLKKLKKMFSARVTSNVLRCMKQRGIFKFLFMFANSK